MEGFVWITRCYGRLHEIRIVEGCIRLPEDVVHCGRFLAKILALLTQGLVDMLKSYRSILHIHTLNYTNIYADRTRHASRPCVGQAEGKLGHCARSLDAPALGHTQVVVHEVGAYQRLQNAYFKLCLRELGANMACFNTCHPDILPKYTTVEIRNLISTKPLLEKYDVCRQVLLHRLQRPARGVSLPEPLVGVGPALEGGAHDLAVLF